MQEGMKWADYRGESPGNQHIRPFTPQDLKVFGHYLLFIAEGGEDVLK